MQSRSKQIQWLVGLGAATLGIALVIVVPCILLIGMDWGGRGIGTSGARELFRNGQFETYAVAFAAMAVVWRAGAMRPLAAAVGAVCLCLALLQLARIWFEGGWLDELLFESRGTRIVMTMLFLWSIPLAGVALLGTTRFNGALAAIRWLALAAVCSPPLVYTLALLNGQIGWDARGEFWFMLFRIAMTAQTSALLILPVLQFAFGARERGERDEHSGEAAALAVAVTCPRCREAQDVPVGRSRCRKCRLTITIEVEEPRCWACRYLIHNLNSPRCPECGADLKAQETGRGNAVTGPTTGVEG